MKIFLLTIRVRLRLLDDIEINESVIRRGNYVYTTVSGF